MEIHSFFLEAWPWKSAGFCRGYDPGDPLFVSRARAMEFHLLFSEAKAMEIRGFLFRAGAVDICYSSQRPGPWRSANYFRGQGK